MKPIQFGKYRIDEPCQVPEGELKGRASGRQFCDRCQKHVHDISGWEPHQIDALYKAHGGQVCAAFFASKPPLAADKPEARKYRLLPQWLSGAAATVTLSWLLLRAGDAQAAEPTTSATVVDSSYTTAPEGLTPASPLLLSSVILDQDTLNIQDDIVLTLTLPNGSTREIVTHAGFFALNLEGLAKPEDKIRIHIAEQKFEDYSGSRVYPEVRQSVRADAGQNQTIVVQVVYKFNMKMRGAMRR